MRRILVAIVGLVLLMSPAMAGDTAERSILGFSPDGAYFAFEQYGVQDGSGFPYASIFVIETATDSWVDGSPFEVRLENDGASLDDARQAALAEAAPLLTSLGIGEPGLTLVTNPFTEVPADPHLQAFFATPYPPPTGQVYTLDIDELPLPAGDCPKDFGYTYVGYGLALADPDGGVRDLHRDTRIPASRNCPIGYSVSDVILHHDVLIVLLNMHTLGFEGPNRRFLAIATTLP